MKWFRSLRTRFLLLHLVVILVGALTMLFVGQYLATLFFDQKLVGLGLTPGSRAGNWWQDEVLLQPTPEGPELAGADLDRAFDAAIRPALLIAVAVSAVAATTVSAFATKRLLAPIKEIRRASQRMASGSYHEQIDLPAEPELAALAEDVNALGRALEETERRRTRLISEVAHELRSPLTTLEGYIEGLLDGVFVADDEVLGTAGREVRRMKRLADDLSALSRAEEGADTFHVEQVDLNTIAREVSSRLAPQIVGQGLHLETELNEPLPVRGDHDRLVQVITNLMANALAYTPSGGAVCVVGRREGHEGLVQVSDDGAGLNLEQIEGVFERFYRADRSRPGGTGIGLTIARSIARRHGGELSAASRGLGLGSTFTLRLPLRPPGA
jgi:histidine kinase